MNIQIFDSKKSFDSKKTERYLIFMDKYNKNDLPDSIRRLILSWLTAATAEYLLLTGEMQSLEGVEGLKHMSFLRVVLVTVILFCGFSVFSCCLRKWSSRKTLAEWERYGILVMFGILTLFSVRASFTLPFVFAVSLLLSILAVYAIYGMKIVHVGRDKTEQGCRQHVNTENTDKTERRILFFVGLLTLLFFCFVSMWTVFRVLTYSAPAFDFGIFSQIFYRMKETGLPETTVERDGLLSHFKVHVSPVYYLMLPFYCLSPEPVTLQILQAAVLALAVIPAWKLARKHGCTPAVSAMFCVILLLYPAFSGGVSYDLHENSFLILFLLWLFYAIDCQKNRMTGIFAVLTLMVKEDAAVYVAVVALWTLLRSLLHRESGWDRKRGIVTGGFLFVASVSCFLLVTGYLEEYGKGVMTYRYDNFIYDGSSSLLTVIKSVISSPMKVIYECADSEKIPFILQTMLPLYGLPLMTRRYERYVLLIPYILVNLMSDYHYQHEIFFQYTYGSMACLFYLTIVNYADLAGAIREISGKIIPLIPALIISGALFTGLIVPKALRYPTLYKNQKADYIAVREALQVIPEEASVSASTFYVVPLSRRDILYDVQYSSEEHVLSTDYVVIDPRRKNSYVRYGASPEEGYECFIELLLENGYTLTGEVEDRMLIYRK